MKTYVYFIITMHSVDLQDTIFRLVNTHRVTAPVVAPVVQYEQPILCCILTTYITSSSSLFCMGVNTDA